GGGGGPLPATRVARPAGGPLEPADHPERRRLPASGGSEHAEELPFGDVEREIVDGLRVTERLRHAFEANVDFRQAASCLNEEYESMPVTRLRSRDYASSGPEGAIRASERRQAVVRVLDVAGVSDTGGVDSERNGTPSASAGAGLLAVGTRAPSRLRPSDAARRRCLPARRSASTATGLRSLPRGVRSRIRRGRTVATSTAETRITTTRIRPFT